MLPKHWKYIVIVVSLFVTIFTLSAFPRQSIGPSLSASPSTVVPNQSVNLQGANFTASGSATINAASDTSSITLNGSSSGLRSSGDAPINAINDGNPITINNEGSWTSSLIIPLTHSTLTGGTQTLEVMDSAGKVASTTLTLTSRNIAITPSNSAANSEVTITGSGYPTNTNITVSYEWIEVSESTTDSSGTFSTNFTIPTELGVSNNQIAVRFSFINENGAATTVTNRISHSITAAYTGPPIPTSTPVPPPTATPAPTPTPAYIADPFAPGISGVTTAKHQLKMMTLNGEYQINSATPGSQIRLTGFHFPSNGEIVSVLLTPMFSPNNGIIDITPYSYAFSYVTEKNEKQYFQSDRSGWFDRLITVPDAPAGSYIITATVEQIIGGLSGEGSTDFVIKPSVGSNTMLVEIAPKSTDSGFNSVSDQCTGGYPDTLTCKCVNGKWSQCVAKAEPTQTPIPTPTVFLENISNIEISLFKDKVNIDSSNTHHLAAHDIYYGPNQICAEDL